jgi:hypothetical protein
MFDILIPIVGIALATAVICFIIIKSPLPEPFKAWIWWGALAIGLLWALSYVLPIFGVSL